MPTRRSTPRDDALTALRAIVHALYRSARGVESRTGRTNAQIALLGFLALRGPLTVNQLATLARTRQNTVSTVLTRLERAGLVRREPSADDRRVVLVRPTPAGKALVRRAPRPATEQLLRAIDALTPAQASALARALQPLLRAMQPGRKQPPMLFE
jgi:DNA-binding MarR family transcriptional regulator